MMNFHGPPTQSAPVDFNDYVANDANNDIDYTGADLGLSLGLGVYMKM